MVFPTTSTLLDDFNRASLGANWTTLTGAGNYIFSSIAFTSSSSGGDSSDASYYHAAAYGPSLDLFATFRWTSAGSWAALRITRNQGSGTTDGYALYVSTNGTDRIRFYREDNEVLTQVGSQVSYVPTDLDKIGMDRDGDTMRVHVDEGSGWTQLASWSDSTYNTGSFNMTLENSFDLFFDGSAWDDMSGGTKAASGGARPPLSRWHRQAVVRAAHY